MTNTEHVLKASGHWTNDDSDTASVWCTHPRCAFWTQQGGYNEDCWDGYDWDGSRPLTLIVAEAQAAHDAWLAERTPNE